MSISTTLKLEQPALPQWQLQDAKNRFRALVNVARPHLLRVQTL
jgi:hypothetical protein